MNSSHPNPLPPDENVGESPVDSDGDETLDLDDDGVIESPSGGKRSPLDPREFDAEIRAETHFDIKVLKNFDTAKRLDAYLAARMPEVSRAEFQRLLGDGEVLVNGRKVKPSYSVRLNDRIVGDLPARFASKPVPENIPLDIIYEDEFIVVLNKQANFIVHPGRGKANWSGTLTNALQFHFDKLSLYAGAARPGIVHRLDRDTTGLLVVAKDEIAHKNLGHQFEYRKVKKQYLALCYNVVERDSDYVRLPIGTHPTVREKMAIRHDPKIGKPAETFYEVRERFNGYTLVSCFPHTGRTHQIRLHLESVGAPILADKHYSGRQRVFLSELLGTSPAGEQVSEEDPLLIDRQALHAYKLRFRHPRCGEEMEFTAIPPTDFMQTLTALREHRSRGDQPWNP